MSLNKNERSLSGSLGVLSIIFMVIATAAPLTVMVAVTPLMITLGNGAGLVFDVFIGTCIMFLFAIGFVKMSKYIHSAGAFYAFVQKGLGRELGLGCATLACVTYFFILLALEAYIGVALSDLLKSFFDVSIPWWILSFAIIAIIGFLGYRHIELSSKFLGVALIAEIAIVLVVNFFFFKDQGITALSPSVFNLDIISSGSAGLGILFAIFAFVGFESTVIFREEAKNPEKTIPLATYIAVLTVGIFYVMSTWVLVSVVGSENLVAFTAEHGEHAYLLVAEQFLGKAWTDVILVLLVTSLFACILSLHNVIVRYQYVLGKYGVISGKFSSVHSRHKSPYFSSFFQTMCSVSCLVLLLIANWDPVANIYTWGAAAGTLGYIAILALTCFSVIVFFLKKKEGNIATTFIAPVLAFAGLLYILGMAIVKLPLLVGDSFEIAQAVALVLVLAFAFGFTVAKLMKNKAPEKFEKLKELA